MTHARILVVIVACTGLIAGCGFFGRSSDPSSRDDHAWFYTCDAYNALADGQGAGSRLKADITAHGWDDAVKDAATLTADVAKARERLDTAGDLTGVSPSIVDWNTAVTAWVEPLRLADNLAAKGLSATTDQATLQQIATAVDGGGTAQTTAKAKLDAAHAATGGNC
jgi:hypothetical protein